MSKKKKPVPPRTEHTQPNGATYYTFANQKDVEAKLPKAQKPFLSLGSEHLYSAMRELTYGGFKLFLYFANNQNNHRFALSHKAIGELTGMSKSTYDRGVNELIDKGYLIRYKESNFYRFVVDPLFGGMNMEDYFKWCDETNK